MPDGQAGRPLRERAALIARVMVYAGVAAANVGRLDLAAGLGFLEALAAGEGVPWIAANLETRDGRRPFPAWRKVRWGGLRVGVVGVTRPEPEQDRRLGIRVADPVETLARVLPEIWAQDVDAVVLLSNLGLEREKELARRFPRIRLIVGGGTYPYLPEPPVVGGTVILHAGDRGRFLGVLETDAASLRERSAPVNRGQEGVWKARLASAEARLRKAPPDTARAVLNAWNRQAAAARATLERIRTSKVWFTHRIVPLSPDVAEIPEVASWVRRVTGRPQPPTGTRPRRVPATHTGSAGCRGCHPKVYRWWVSTRHARAYTPLRGKRPDPRCLGCHATRVVRGTGASTEPAVGCEACHGPGAKHRGAGNIVGVPPPATCRRCHRGYHPNEAFDEKAARAKIRCPKG
ncbi:multiheme c-type cytochrome [Deferrisoma camini]|uniref:multiheme c-type cytochrome n=1 Tax=Deferrisoma camini TaxID=1035120 RepID=UPI00046D04D4|nr:multiheme c-type cytochrome [Deferrisoma camini]